MFVVIFEGSGGGVVGNVGWVCRQLGLWGVWGVILIRLSFDGGDMPAKTGASHSFGYLISVLVGGLLVEHILTYVPSSRFVSRRVGELLTAYTSVPVSAEVAGMLLIAGVLTGVWGVGFHLYRY